MWGGYLRGLEAPFFAPMPTHLISKADAVNQCLRAVGSSPINSIEDDDLPGDAELALQTVDKVDRELQAEGWHFNTSRGNTLNLDVDGRIPVGTTAISVDVNNLRYSEIDPVLRGNYLYDMRNSTDIFTEALEEVTIVQHLQWDSLPQEARLLVSAMAALEFGLGSGLITYSKEQDLLRQAKQARASLNRQNIQKGDFSMFGSISGNRIFNSSFRRHFQ